MTADDCARIIGAVAAAQAVTIAALAKVYLAVRRNSASLEAVSAVVGPSAVVGENRT